MDPGRGRPRGLRRRERAARRPRARRGQRVRLAGAGGFGERAGTSFPGSTALLVATVRGHIALALFLLDRGADPNVLDAGFTPLFWAAGTWENGLANPVYGFVDPVRGIPDRNDKLRLVKALLSHGANPNLQMTIRPPGFTGTGTGGYNDAVGATPFIVAANAADVEMMRLLVAAGAWYFLKSGGPPAAVGPVRPVSVLVANFDNRAQDPLLDGLVEQAVGVGIEGASFVSIYPRRDALRLVSEQKLGAALNEDTARLVAIREGVDRVVAGSIAAQGNRYDLAVKVVDVRKTNVSIDRQPQHVVRMIRDDGTSLEKKTHQPGEVALVKEKARSREWMTILHDPMRPDRLLFPEAW